MEAPTRKVGAPTYLFGKFSRNSIRMNKNEKRVAACIPGGPCPGSDNVNSLDGIIGTRTRGYLKVVLLHSQRLGERNLEKKFDCLNSTFEQISCPRETVGWWRTADKFILKLKNLLPAMESLEVGLILVFLAKTLVDLKSKPFKSNFSIYLQNSWLQLNHVVKSCPSGYD